MNLNIRPTRKKLHNVAPRFAGTSINLYINENLSYARSMLLKACRGRINEMNRGVEDKDHCLKSKTVRGNFRRIKTFNDFTRIHPNM